MLVATQHSGLLVFENGATTGFEVGAGSAGYDVTALEQGPDHRLWVFVQHQGLFTYDPGQKKLLPANNSIRQANCLKADRNGRLWLAADNGLFLYDPKTNTYSGNYMAGKGKIVNLCLDKQGVLWIGADGAGLWVLKDAAPQAIALTRSDGSPVINSNSVFTIYEDAEGRKWIGTLRGGINVSHGYQYHRNICILEYARAGERPVRFLRK